MLLGSQCLFASLTRRTALPACASFTLYPLSLRGGLYSLTQYPHTPFLFILFSYTNRHEVLAALVRAGAESDHERMITKAVYAHTLSPSQPLHPLSARFASNLFFSFTLSLSLSLDLSNRE